LLLFLSGRASAVAVAVPPGRRNFFEIHATLIFVFARAGGIFSNFARLARSLAESDFCRRCRSEPRRSRKWARPTRRRPLHVRSGPESSDSSDSARFGPIEAAVGAGLGAPPSHVAHVAPHAKVGELRLLTHVRFFVALFTLRFLEFFFRFHWSLSEEESC